MASIATISSRTGRFPRRHPFHRVPLAVVAGSRGLLPLGLTLALLFLSGSLAPEEAAGQTGCDEGGAQLVADIWDGSDGSYPEWLTVYNDKLYFSANDESVGDELGVYDGTSTTVIDIRPGSNPSQPGSLTVYGNKLYFSAYDANWDKELWEYNGVSASRVADINPGGSSNPQGFIIYKGALYFGASHNEHGHSLWRYDGSNPARITEVNGGGMGVGPFLVYNDRLYFGAYSDTHGRELWVHDGTSTMRLTDINPGGADAAIGGGRMMGGMAVYDDKLYFVADDGTHGQEIWTYDSHTDNVSMLEDLNPDGDSDPQWLTVHDGKLFFSANDGTYGQELWVYDGASFARLSDIWPGSDDATPDWLTVYHDNLYFSAWTPENDAELWRYDGTGVERVADIWTGDDYASEPMYLTVFDDRLFFSADDGTFGTELWSYSDEGGGGAGFTFSPHSGMPGWQVDLTGCGLAGTTRVRFNGVDAQFIVHADDWITAVVPEGATTGPIRLDGAGGPIVSQAPFLVATGDEAASGQGSFNGPAPNVSAVSRRVRFSIEAAYDSDRPGEGSASMRIAGEVEFRDRQGTMSFQSRNLDGLASLSPQSAMLEGTGVFNGQRGYRFLLVVHETKRTDYLRLKIWDKATGAVVYDTQPGAPDTAKPTTPVKGQISVTGGTSGNASKQVYATAEGAEEPARFALEQNYPNPFNPSTEIRFALPEARAVRLVVYDVMGREVARLAEGSFAAGEHRVRWDAGALPSGVYLYRLQAGSFAETRRMTLLK